jgi:hypothetical protein
VIKIFELNFERFLSEYESRVEKEYGFFRPIIKEESPRIPRRAWAEMIRRVYEVNPLSCPKCQGEMRIISFLTDYAVVDRIINHVKLTFVADKPPPPRVASQEFLIAAETSAEYFS